MVGPSRQEPILAIGRTVTIASDLIAFKLKDRQTFEIVPNTLTSLSYGQEAHQKVGTMGALAILMAPEALFELFHKTRFHYIGVQYNTIYDKKAGLLMQGAKDNYRGIIVALQGATGAPVAVSEKDRQLVPIGVTMSVVSVSVRSNRAGSGSANPTQEKSP
jgi:hypothetical protein